MSSRTIRASIGRYKDKLVRASAKGLYASCGIEVPIVNVFYVDRNNSILILLVNSLDIYGLYSNR